eukprot:Gb_13096 [translate_table: standard]
MKGQIYYRLQWITWTLADFAVMLSNRLHINCVVMYITPLMVNEGTDILLATMDNMKACRLCTGAVQQVINLVGGLHKFYLMLNSLQLIEREIPWMIVPFMELHQDVCLSLYGGSESGCCSSHGNHNVRIGEGGFKSGLHWTCGEAFRCHGLSAIMKCCDLLQEPVIKPIWDTFASSISGIWKGVGAAFSPITAEMEPISLGESNEYLYDCYTLCKMEALGSPSEGSNSRIRRKINWVVANPLGEQGQGEVTIQDDLIKAEEKIFEPLDQVMDGNRTPSRAEPEKIDMLGVQEKQHLPIYETKVLLSSDVMEEDFIGLEPGLVFFEL